MTYKEAYMELETIKDLEREIKRDTTYALMVNPDRVKHIIEAGEYVANLKFVELTNE